MLGSRELRKKNVADGRTERKKKNEGGNERKPRRGLVICYGELTRSWTVERHETRACRSSTGHVNIACNRAFTGEVSYKKKLHDVSNVSSVAFLTKFKKYIYFIKCSVLQAQTKEQCENHIIRTPSVCIVYLAFIRKIKRIRAHFFITLHCHNFTETPRE